MSSLIKKNNNQFLLLKNSFDEFIKIALMNILEVRDNNFNSSNFNNSSNSDNYNKNSFSLSFDDSFNSNISNNSSSILYIIEIDLISNNEKILCEKWTFQFDKIDFSDNKNYSLKLNTLLRSVYFISRIIPCYNIFINEKTNFEYKLVSNRKQKFFNHTKTKIHYIHLQNLTVEYISNEDIKKLEEETFQKKHNGFILLKLPNNNNNNNKNRLSLNPNMIFQKRNKRLLSFEIKDNENISDIVNNNNNNVSFQSDLNEIKHLFYKNKSNGSSMKKLNTMDSSNNLDDSYKLEFEILENENDF